MIVSVPGRRGPRGVTSRILHILDWVASRPVIAATVVMLDLAWVVFAVLFQFPTRLEAVFQTLVSAVTLAMVFTIQHTQERERRVIHRKLDEILRVLPGADKTMITLEAAPDEDLTEAGRVHADARESRDTDP